MKRLAAILVVTAAVTGAAPVAAIAAPVGGGEALGECGSVPSPLNLRLIPYC